MAHVGNIERPVWRAWEAIPPPISAVGAVGPKKTIIRCAITSNVPVKVTKIDRDTRKVRILACDLPGKLERFADEQLETLKAVGWDIFEYEVLESEREVAFTASSIVQSSASVTSGFRHGDDGDIPISSGADPSYSVMGSDTSSITSGGSAYRNMLSAKLVDAQALAASEGAARHEAEALAASEGAARHEAEALAASEGARAAALAERLAALLQ
jgi:hypothetical protein